MIHQIQIFKSNCVSVWLVLSTRHNVLVDYVVLGWYLNFFLFFNVLLILTGKLHRVFFSTFSIKIPSIIFFFKFNLVTFRCLTSL